MAAACETASASLCVKMRGRSRRRALTKFARLLETHVVLDRFHARHVPRDAYGLALRRRRADEAAQLDDALERLDIDFRRFEIGLGEDRGPHLAGDDAIVDVFARAFLLGRG